MGEHNTSQTIAMIVAYDFIFFVVQATAPSLRQAE